MKGGADEVNELLGGEPNNEVVNEEVNELLGGAEYDEVNSLTGGATNPGFRAFLDLKEYVASKLGISNGPAAGKIAGAVQRDTKELHKKTHPDLKGEALKKKAMEHFDANMAHYKQMVPKKK
jgi:hypothetical protein